MEASPWEWMADWVFHGLMYLNFAVLGFYCLILVLFVVLLPFSDDDMWWGVTKNNKNPFKGKG